MEQNYNLENNLFSFFQGQLQSALETYSKKTHGNFALLLQVDSVIAVENRFWVVFISSDMGFAFFLVFLNI